MSTLLVQYEFMFTWIWLWHILPVHKIEFPRKRHLVEHWPAFLIVHRSDNNRWWLQSSSDAGQSNTHCGRGQNTEHVGRDLPVMCPGTD